MTLLSLWSARAVELTAERAWEWFGGAPIRILGVIVGAIVLRWFLHRVIDRFLDGVTGGAERSRMTPRRGTAERDAGAVQRDGRGCEAGSEPNLAAAGRRLGAMRIAMAGATSASAPSVR